MTSERDSPHSHWSQCVARVKLHASHLKAEADRRIKKRMPLLDIEQNLGRYILEARAFDVTWHDELMRIGLAHVGESSSDEKFMEWLDNRA